VEVLVHSDPAQLRELTRLAGEGRDARLDRVGFHSDQVSGWDATGATGTVLPGSMVIDADGLTDAIDSLC